MKVVLITGASGYVGYSLSFELANKGIKVHALVRSDSAKELLHHDNISVFKGDILDKESLSKAMKGCQQVYHTAAMVGGWAKDSASFYTVNVEGTRNVLDTALEEGIQKLVFTSTCGVIGPSVNEPMGEDDPRVVGFEIDYELSKKMAEDLVIQYAKNGMESVIVCPSKIYGPGKVSHSMTSNAVIEKFLKKRFVFIPSPGTHKACFAFIDDIVTGHILAMEKGKRGQKYILGGINISYQDFFNKIRTLASVKGRIIRLPKIIIKSWALLQFLNYKITGAHPSFSLKAVNIVFNDYIFSSKKAVNELGYTITPLEEALHKTIHSLNSKKYA